MKKILVSLCFLFLVACSSTQVAQKPMAQAQGTSYVAFRTTDVPVEQALDVCKKAASKVPTDQVEGVMTRCMGSYGYVSVTILQNLHY